MEASQKTPSPIRAATRMFGGGDSGGPAIQQAAWVARCVGRGKTAPFVQEDVSALAATLKTRRLQRGGLLFRCGERPEAVWILRDGRVELSVGSGRKRVVVHVLGPGDVEGDIQHLLEMPMPYSARALDDVTVLCLGIDDFESLLATRHAIARRWLSSVAMRLAASQERVIGMLGRSLTEQVARLLLDEAEDGSVPLPQATLAAMLGVQRPSLNKILKEFERQRLVTVRYGAIDLLDVDRLTASAG